MVCILITAAGGFFGQKAYRAPVEPKYKSDIEFETFVGDLGGEQGSYRPSSPAGQPVSTPKPLPALGAARSGLDSIINDYLTHGTGE
jgi:hypothetical protein